jgi:hypothetical protein
MRICQKSWLVATALWVGGCSAAPLPTDAGCAAYGEARLDVPRPLGGGPLAAWVADLDDRMTGTCR